MSGVETSLQDRAAELRREFDRSFAEAPRTFEARTTDLLAIRIGTERYALRLSEITGLFADKRISAIPSEAPALLGIAGFRGAIIPVYDLRILLGYPPSTEPRWLVVAAGKLAALAFDSVDGHLRLRNDAVASNSESFREHVVEIAREPEARPIVRLASILDAIEKRARELNPKREQIR